jgi:Tfp pilus assembly protein PilP
MPSHWQAELKRERQPLEAHALRDLFLTGTLRQGLNWFALVRVGGIVHTLQVGDYVGPDLGLVRSVDEEGLDLREIGRDPSGQWVELPRRWRVGVSP